MLSRKTRSLHRSVRHALVAVGAATVLVSVYLLVTPSDTQRLKALPEWAPHEELPQVAGETGARTAAAASARPALIAERLLEAGSIKYGGVRASAPGGGGEGPSRAALVELVQSMARKQEVRNAKRLDFRLEPDGIILVVQVHDRHEYLRHAVDSMRRVDGIAGTLVVFSHDFYSKQVFDIVKAIDFMPVLQIFYPSAMQLYPDEFPGADPNDCPRDLSKQAAVARGCVNAQHPDKYGHYREARYVQTKHHWFWKLNHVYSGLAVTKDFHGTIVLLEDDHYLMPDFIYMLKKMSTQRSSICPECNLFSLGNYKLQFDAYASGEVVVNKFVSSKHNMAMAFNRTLYERIKVHAKEFCTYDDYNWDWTLQHVGKLHLAGDIVTLVPHLSRAFHMGQCGIHHVNQDCDPSSQVLQFERQIGESRGLLFPQTLTRAASSVSDISVPSINPNENGGWGDPRDHQLCLSFASSVVRSNDPA